MSTETEIDTIFEMFVTLESEANYDSLGYLATRLKGKHLLRLLNHSNFRAHLDNRNEQMWEVIDTIVATINKLPNTKEFEQMIESEAQW